jgi:ribosomal protein S18 acetylase RimI-like enzyme
MPEFASYEPRSWRGQLPEGFIVREGTPGDVDACVALLMAVRGGQQSEWLPMFERTLAADDKILFVAEVGDEIVGYARAVTYVSGADAPPDVVPDGIYLMGLVVAEGWRRRGVAEQLTTTRMQWGWARADVVWYFASAENRASLDLHGRLGFREVTRDFSYPGLTFTGGIGVLCRCDRPAGPD